MEPHERSSTFVGRDDELRVLARDVAEAAAGRGRLVTIAGDAGIGKSRAIEELIARASLPAGRVVWGSCAEQSGAPAYWPWVRAVGAYVAERDPEMLATELGADAPEIAQLVPTVRERVPHLSLPVPSGPDESRFRLFDAMEGFLRRASADVPLLIVLDDLQWADAASLQLLAFLARELRGMRLLLLASHRPVRAHEAAGLMDCLARASRRLHLHGLPRKEVARFVERVAGSTPAPGLVADLHRITEGNPFFLGEFVRMLEAEQALGSPELASLRVKLPVELRATIRHRLAPLADEDRRWLDVAAVIGREFDARLLEVACEIPADPLLERLGRAVAAGLVEEVPATLGRFRFAHALIRETLYDDLAPLARAQLHLRVGRALEGVGDGPDAPCGELAHHFLNAATLGDPTTALAYAERAGGQAEARHAYEEAVGHFRSALQVGGLMSPDEPRRLKLLLALAGAALRASDTVTARATFEEAAGCAMALGDASALAHAALGYWEGREPMGAVDATEVRLLEAALRAVGTEDSAVRARLLLGLSRALLSEADPTRRRGLLEEALAVARRVGDPGALATALLGKHFALLGPTDVNRRRAVIARAVELAEQARAGPIASWSRTLLIHDLLESCDIAGAEREIDVLKRDAERTHLPLQRWAAMMLQAGLAISSGRVEEGARLAARALEVPRDGKDPTILQIYCTQIFVARRETGTLGASLEQSIAGFAEAYPAMHSWRCMLAVMHAEAGRPEAARALVERIGRREFADVPRDVHYFPALALLAEAVRLLGDGARAAQLYPLLLPYADRNVVTSWWSPACLGSVARYLGLLAATAGQLDEATRHFERAAAANAQMGARGWLAHTHADHVAVLFARNGAGDREHAGRLLAEARSIAEQLGLSRLRGQLAGFQLPAPREESGSPRTAVLRRGDGGWTIGIDDQMIELKDGPGIAYLATLLRQPGREFHVLDLVAGSGGPTDATRAIDLGDAGELLDAPARAAYKQRLADVEAELEEAQRFNDPGRVARAQQEAQFLTAELARAVGLGGRSRRAGSASERARVNVTKVLGRVIDRIATGNAALGQHLSATVRRGLYCCYAPDPRLALRWIL